MIATNIKGGLGNQLFCFAAGYALSRQRNEELVLDISRYENRKDRRGFALKKFPLDLRYSSYGALKKTMIKIYRRLTHLFEKGLIPFLPVGNAFFFEKGYGFDTDFLYAQKKAKYIDGYWHDINYFKQYKNDLQQLFMPLLTPDKILISQEAESVAVHVRRGDYLQESRFAIQEQEYFIKAVDLVKSKLTNPIFYFFSDDHSFVKKHLLEATGGILVEGGDLISDFFWMRKCKHHIISNSTFSWWPAWLNSNKNKIVIAPKNWFTDGTVQNLLLEDWILL